MITFAPAKPVLDAVIEMREPLRWLNQRRRSRRPLFEPEQAGELINLIPNGNRIAKAGAMFLEAEEIPAPEAWLHIAIGLMLQSEANPNAIDGDAYRCAVADGAYRHPETWEHYGAGFSAAVIVRAIRQARRQGALPSPGGFLNLCANTKSVPSGGCWITIQRTTCPSEERAPQPRASNGPNQLGEASSRSSNPSFSRGIGRGA